MGNLNRIFFVLLVSIFISSCIVTTRIVGDTHTTSGSALIGGKLYTSAWIQQSAEYKALCQQAYNIARERVERATSGAVKNGAKPWAIITDIDETILDNTPNAVHLALRGKDFSSQSWNEWCELAAADTLMGALDFFCFAQDRGVEIFYVSNRDEVNREGTIENLHRFGFPSVDDDHLLLRKDSSDKSDRRTEIMNNYNVLLLLGDNLGDFDHLFDSLNSKDREEALLKFRTEFGRKFIVIPNPNYGTWERVILHGATSRQDQERLLIHSLRTQQSE